MQIYIYFFRHKTSFMLCSVKNSLRGVRWVVVLSYDRGGVSKRRDMKWTRHFIPTAQNSLKTLT
jgi:hypothetical protein